MRVHRFFLGPDSTIVDDSFSAVEIANHMAASIRFASVSGLPYCQADEIFSRLRPMSPPPGG